MLSPSEVIPGSESLPELLAPANFSACRRYRYTLARDLDPMGLTDNRHGGICLWIGLNPSTADEHKSDPTCTREMNFTRAWGHRHYLKCNAFAWRDTLPANMKRVDDPIGPDNDAWISRAAREAERIIVCWGTHAVHRGRDRDVLRRLEPFRDKLYCLKVTAGGHPGHPLYLPANSEPMPFARAA